MSRKEEQQLKSTSLLPYEYPHFHALGILLLLRWVGSLCGAAFIKKVSARESTKNSPSFPSLSLLWHFSAILSDANEDVHTLPRLKKTLQSPSFALLFLLQKVCVHGCPFAPFPLSPCAHDKNLSQNEETQEEEGKIGQTHAIHHIFAQRKKKKRETISFLSLHLCRVSGPFVYF